MSIVDKIGECFFHCKVALRLRLDWYRLKKRCNHARAVKIQFGCGNRPRKGWLNTDLVPEKGSGAYALDVKKRMPFNDGIATFIFLEHLIEHLTKKEGIAFLEECYRILEPGGVIRIAWPELSNIVHAYLLSDPKAWDTGNPESETPGDKVNDCFYLFGHKYIYDFHTLKLTMERIDYVNFQQMERGKSSYPELQNMEQRPGSIAVIEAQKPLRS